MLANPEKDTPTCKHIQLQSLKTCRRLPNKAGPMLKINILHITRLKQSRQKMSYTCTKRKTVRANYTNLITVTSDAH